MIIMMMTITMMLLIAKDKIQFSPTTQSILDHWISWRHWSTETTYTKVNLFAFVSRLGMYFAKTSESTLEKGCLFWYLCWLIQVHHSPKNATGIGSNWGAWNGNASTVFFSNLGGSVLSSFHQISYPNRSEYLKPKSNTLFFFCKFNLNNLWSYMSLFVLYPTQPVEAVKKKLIKNDANLR